MTADDRPAAVSAPPCPACRGTQTSLCGEGRDGGLVYLCSACVEAFYHPDPDSPYTPAQVPAWAWVALGGLAVIVVLRLLGLPA